MGEVKKKQQSPNKLLNAISTFLFIRKNREVDALTISEKLGIPLGTVKSRLNYARKAIKASVEEYEKKNNIKLHALPFFPFIKWVFAGAETAGSGVAASVAEGVSVATGTAISISGGATAATVAAGTTAAVGTTAAATGIGAAATGTTAATVGTAATTVGIGAKIIALPLVTKIIAGVVATGIAIGGVTTAVVLNDNEKAADSSNVSSVSDKRPTVAGLSLSGVIPKGCVYTLYNGTVLKEGDKFPETCTAGDTVLYGDYYYGYECVYGDNNDGTGRIWYMWDELFDDGDSGLTRDDVFGAWSPIAADRTKTQYGPVLQSINGKQIKALFYTYGKCVNMIKAPTIPNSVKSISMAYMECTSLKTAPIIPQNVERVTGAFHGCTSLTGDVVFNGTLDKSTFWYSYGTFSNTVRPINLTGSVPEEDLLYIAYESNMPNVTVNGKTVDYEAEAKKREVARNIESLKNEYSWLPTLVVRYMSYFSSQDEIRPVDAMWFATMYLRDSNYQVQTNDETIAYEIPMSDICDVTETFFGKQYNMSSIKNEVDNCFGIYTANYMDDKDAIMLTALGGAGDSYHPEIIDVYENDLGNYSISIGWYDVYGEELPENTTAWKDENGYYWVADKIEVVEVEFVHDSPRVYLYSLVRQIN